MERKHFNNNNLDCCRVYRLFSNRQKVVWFSPLIRDRWTTALHSDSFGNKDSMFRLRLCMEIMLDIINWGGSILVKIEGKVRINEIFKRS